jgi:hypothetical protein
MCAFMVVTDGHIALATDKQHVAIQIKTKKKQQSIIERDPKLARHMFLCLIINEKKNIIALWW